MNDKFLYEHNYKAYEKIVAAFAAGEKVVGIVQATGTGKSYIALQLALDKENEKIMYLVPSTGIIEHLQNIISKHNLTDKLAHIKFATYQSLVNLSEEELASLDVTFLIMDEFHHIGAPIWGNRLNTLIKHHPDLKILGMSAYTVRDRGTIYERDLAEPTSNELFAGKIVNRYDLVDAMIDGVLPKPNYKTAYVDLDKMVTSLETTLNNRKIAPDALISIQKILNDAKRQIARAPKMKDVIKENIKEGGKYIYFCPPISEAGVNDISSIQKEAYDWFKSYVKEEDIIFYTSTSQMGEKGRKNREAFYHDIDLKGNSTKGKLRVMFAINQYNEGIHAPNLDGVILGRGTSSDIVFFEQIGRALSLPGNLEAKKREYENLSLRELQNLCRKRKINYHGAMKREELIEKLISPVILDLANNVEYIKQLENNLQIKIREIYNKEQNNQQIHLQNAMFDISIINNDLFTILSYVRERLNFTWEDYFSLLTNYYQAYGNSEVPLYFKTYDGLTFDNTGFSLGNWTHNLRKAYRNNLLSEEQIEKLEQIDFRFTTLNYDEAWNKAYQLLVNFYNEHGHVNIPSHFKTRDGLSYDDNGFDLSYWANKQRVKYKKGLLVPWQITKLQNLNFRLVSISHDKHWEKMYELLASYYNHYQNIIIPIDFKTLDGINYDASGFALGEWLYRQKIKAKNNNYSLEHKDKLSALGYDFTTVSREDNWTKMYELLKAYSNHFHTCEVPQNFKTIDGITYDAQGLALGSWIKEQRKKYSLGKLDEEKIALLQALNCRLEIKNYDDAWAMHYALLVNFFNVYGHANVPQLFITSDGITEDALGIHLGNWVSKQRRAYKTGKLTDEQITKLNAVNFKYNMRMR